MNAVTILEKGSSKVKLQAIAKNFFSICLKSNIHFQAQWIPRGENEVADYFSKLADPDDWGISDEFFHFLSKLGPMLTIDRFANAQNKKNCLDLILDIGILNARQLMRLVKTGQGNIT